MSVVAVAALPVIAIRIAPDSVTVSGAGANSEPMELPACAAS